LFAHSFFFQKDSSPISHDNFVNTLPQFSAFFLEPFFKGDLKEFTNDYIPQSFKTLFEKTKPSTYKKYLKFIDTKLKADFFHANFKDPERDFGTFDENRHLL